MARRRVIATFRFLRTVSDGRWAYAVRLPNGTTALRFMLRR